VEQKNSIERKFYNEKAKELLLNLSEKELLYDPCATFPLRYKYFHSLFSDIKGKKVLDCGCGTGYHSVLCAKKGALVTAIDISEEMLKISKMRAKYNGVLDKIHFCLMSVEEMSFSKREIFDIVIGCGVLHHLQLELAGKRISEVLKKGGKAIFLEPLINSRLLLWIRSLIPVPCHESPGGGGLTYKDITTFGSFFRKTSIKHFLHIFTRIKIEKLESILDRIDSVLLLNFPSLRKLAGGVVIEYTR
jgi:ubiquinone/menaquinone biosynthesis C-methylase UbiE